MSAGDGSDRGHRRSSGRRSSRWWRRPRWPDSRFVSPLDDGIPLWLRLLVLVLLLAGIWWHGQTGFPVSVDVPFAALVLAVLLGVAVGCWLVSNGRLRALAHAQSQMAAVDEAPPRTPSSPRWWRTARWPDGRYVSGGDGVASTVLWIGYLSVLAAAWVLGRMGIPDAGIDDSWGSLGILLILPACLMGLASSRRALGLAEGGAAHGQTAP